MKYPKVFLMLGIGAVALLAIPGVEMASAETILCTEKAAQCPAAKADGTGTEIKFKSTGTSKVTTSFKNIECGKSSVTAKVTSTGKTVGATVEGLTFEECNCEVKVLAKGTLQLERITSSENARVTSTNTEVTVECSTIFGKVHCIYQTKETDFGTLEGGNPATLKPTELNIPRTVTNGLCAEQANWDATYEVTSPKPLFVEGETAPPPAETVLCTESKNPCPSAKADGVGAEIKASLVSGTKSKLTTIYNNIECGKSSLTAKVTSTGKTIETSVEALTFEECNCEVKVLTKGTLELAQISNTATDATATSSNMEITTTCGTTEGSVHCVYKTTATNLGTLEGGNPAKIKISGASIPRLEGAEISKRCGEGETAKWDVEYEVTSPKPLYTEPGMVEGAVLCTEKASPCPAGKSDGSGTEIKASLVSGTKSKLTTPYNNIECGKSAITAKVTSTGETAGASVEGLTLEECNCEVKVLANGTLGLTHITGGDNATVTSTGTEITTSCSTIFGTVHCIYTTSATDLGTLEGGNPARLNAAKNSIPHPATNTHCAEGAVWDAEYEVTSPKPLYIEPE